MKRYLSFIAGALAAVATRADVPQGLLLRFTFDEFRNGGMMLPDMTGSNNNGRVAGVRYAAAGRLGGGCEFLGKNSSVQVPSAPALNIRRGTFCTWFKTDKSPLPDRVLLEKGPDTGFALLVAGGDKEAARKGKLIATVAGHDAFSNESVADNAWHHAAATFDGENLKLYVDGALQKQVTAWSGEMPGNTHDLTLGMNRSNPSSKEKEAAFEGLLDEVMLFNRALSEAEIKDVLSATKPKFTKQQVERRLAELKDLFDRGLILQDFYDRKVKECEVEK